MSVGPSYGDMATRIEGLTKKDGKLMFTTHVQTLADLIKRFELYPKWVAILSSNTLCSLSTSYSSWLKFLTSILHRFPNATVYFFIPLKLFFLTVCQFILFPSFYFRASFFVFPSRLYTTNLHRVAVIHRSVSHSSKCTMCVQVECTL